MTDEEYTDLIEEMKPLLIQGTHLFRLIVKALNKYEKAIRHDPTLYRREVDLKEIFLALALFNKLLREESTL